MTAVVGEKIVFKYSASHNVYMMPSAVAYTSCNFTGATSLATTSLGGGSGMYPNQYTYTCAAGGGVYLACQVGGHCAGGQKVFIQCTSTVSAATRSVGVGFYALLGTAITAMRLCLR